MDTGEVMFKMCMMLSGSTKEKVLPCVNEDGVGVAPLQADV